MYPCPESTVDGRIFTATMRPLDEAASLRLAYMQDVPAALTGLSFCVTWSIPNPPVSAALTPEFIHTSYQEAHLV